MTTPDNVLHYGADVSKLLAALKQVREGLTSSADVTDQQVRRMKTALTQMENLVKEGNANIDKLLNKPVVGEVPAFRRMAEDLNRVAQEARLAAVNVQALNRIKNAPISGGSGSFPRVSLSSAQSGTGLNNPAFTDAMNRYNASVRRETEAHNTVADRLETAARTGSPGSPYAGGAGAGAGGGSGGFRNDVRSGFFGGDNTGFGRSVGQAARFGLVYGAIYKVLTGVQQTLQFTLAEAVDFQKGVTELTLATDQSRDAAKGLANNLADTANKYGIDSREGIQTGTKLLGVFGALDTTATQQGAVARQGTQAITQQAFLSGKDAQELTANTAAIAQAFGLGAESIGRITDTMTFFEKNFGIAAGSLSESLPAISSLAHQTGFTIEQSAGLAAAVQSRTGGTAASASGLLSQILTREGEGTVQDIFDRLDIVGVNFAERFQKLADVLPTLSGEQRGQVAAAFGRGRSQSAAIGLLESLDKIYSLSGKASLSAAAGGSVGLTDQQAKQRLNDIGGQLAQLSGAFKGFAKELSQTGLLDALGGAVIGLRELAKVTTDILQVWNLVPHVVQDALIALGLFTVATRFASGTGVAGGLAGRAAGLGNAVAAGGIALRGGSAIGLGLAGRAGFAALGGPVGLAVGGLLAVGAAKGAFDTLNAASQKANDSLITLGNTDFNSLDSLTGARRDLTKAAQDRRASAPSAITNPIQSLVGLFTGESGKRARDAARLESANTVAGMLEDVLKKRDTRNASNSPAITAFGDFSQDAISNGYTRLKEKGYTAAQAMDLLTKSIDDNANSAKARQQLFDSETVGLQQALGLTKTLRDFAGSSNLLSGTSLEKVNAKTFLGTSGGLLKENREIPLKDIADELVNSLPNAQDLFAFIKPRLDKANADGKVTNAESRQIAEDAIRLGDVSGLSKKYSTATMEQIIKALALGGAEGIIAAAQVQKNAADPDTILANAKATVLQANQDRVSDVLSGDSAGLAKALKQNIKSLSKQIDVQQKAGKQVGDLLLEQARTSRQLQQAIVERDLHPAFLAAATASAKAAGTTSTTDDQAAAVQQAAAELDKAKRLRGTEGGDIAYQTALGNYNRAKLGQADSVRKEAESIKDILGAQVGSTLANAVSAMRDAQKTMDLAITDAEKNAAQIGLLNAQRQLSQARLGALHTNRLLNLDRTNPVQVAREEAAQARAAYDAERKAFTQTGSAGGRKITAVERQRLQELQLGIGDADQNAKQTAFQQTLSKTQTANSLGRLSQTAYLGFLKTQENLLTTQIAGMSKTSEGYQQAQDNLNQILGLEKDVANSLNSQFNLGQITLPTDYQARRYAQSIAGGPNAFIGGQGSSVVNSNNQITLTGLTADQMQAFMESFFGAGNTQTGSGYTP